MEVKPQQVNKWVSGKEIFRLDTIIKLSEILEVDLISIKPFHKELDTTTFPTATPPNPPQSN